MRELRGGLRGFYVFVACIALGVFAIAGVGALSASLSDSLEREGRTLLGGDIAFSLIQREAKPEERAFLATQGQVSAVATMRGMVRAADGQLALVELKSVDGAYPTLGRITAEPQTADERAARRAQRRIRRRGRRRAAGAARPEGRRPRQRRCGDIRNPLGDQLRARQARRRRRAWARAS